jgi:branched-chain amino acid transport system ATP-binding protein
MADIGSLFETFPVLARRRKQISGYLSGGERQMLAIAQALLCGPKLLRPMIRRKGGTGVTSTK